MVLLFSRECVYCLALNRLMFAECPGETDRIIFQHVHLSFAADLGSRDTVEKVA